MAEMPPPKGCPLALTGVIFLIKTHEIVYTILRAELSTKLH